MWGTLFAIAVAASVCLSVASLAMQLDRIKSAAGKADGQAQSTHSAAPGIRRG